MLCAILKPNRLDIVPFVLFIGSLMDLIRITSTSHTVFSQNEGDKYVPLETQGALEPTDGQQISCAFIGPSRVDIVWKWRGGSHSFDPDHYFAQAVAKIGSGDSQITSSHLVWKSGIPETDKRSASGIIYAEGTHQDGSGVSTCDDVTLTVIWKPVGTAILSGYTNLLVIAEDNAMQLTCGLTDKGNPEGQVRWIKNGNIQSESEYNSQTISILVTRDIHGDKWRCYFYNIAGNGEYSNEVPINVHWKPEKPSLLINKDPLNIGEDSMALFTCKLTDKGNPEGQVRWVKNGNLQSGSEYTTEMISRSVTQDMDGDKWQCYYYNRVEDGDNSNEVIVNVHWSPGTATISADTHTPKLDDTLTFTCTGDRGNPPGQVLWYLNARLVANTTSKQRTVTGVNESHNGNWDCMFKNHLNEGASSQDIPITVLCLPGVHVEYITYKFTTGYVNFNLKLRNAFAASTLEVSVCSVDDNPSCEVATSKIEQNNALEQIVGFPESSDGAVYNVTFTFTNNHQYIVTQHGIELQGPVVQGQVPTILAVLFGTLLMVAIVTILALVYIFHCRNKATGNMTQIQAAPDYEDVNAAATTNGQSSNIGNATYMDLDRNDIQQTRNRPAEVTVYQSLN